jgi:NAD(P)-dependent dehydrogenase (short-subunit alcohol dehydrogenase family)
MLQRLAKLGDRVLDPSIVFAFDQTGFQRHRLQFDASDLDTDMSGRVCLVTGANSGLGKAAAKALAARGASVWLLCRNQDRGLAAAAEIKAHTENDQVLVEQVDVSDPRSIDTFVERFEPPHVDVLVNNAGVLMTERAISQSGLETTLATNLLGPLQLTAGLLPRLQAGDRSRVIFVSSGGMYTQRLNVERLLQPPEPFDGVTAYAQTKRAMVELSERIAVPLSKQGVSVQCMHPGWANTPGVARSIPGFWRLTKSILRTPEAGADTIVWLSVCDKALAHPGGFWFDRKQRKTHLLPGTQSSPEMRALLWENAHQWADLNPDVWGACQWKT